MDTRFHLALPCLDLEETRRFYQEIFGANSGRLGEFWLDIDLFGHQLTFALAGRYNFEYKNYRFDGFVLPAFHYGIILDLPVWQDMFHRLSGMDIEITSEVTFLEDQVGEQLSFFVQDPNGYMVEFKSFKDPKAIFRAH